MGSHSHDVLRKPC